MNSNSILREISEKLLALALVLVMLISVIPAFTIAADAAESDLADAGASADIADTGATVGSGEGTWISNKLTYVWNAESDGTTGNSAAGSVSVSNNTLTVTATNSKKSSHTSGCDTVEDPACPTTTTVTVTNESSFPLKFNTLTTSGGASVAGVSQGDTIASGDEFTIAITAPAKDTATKVTGTVTVAVEEQTKVTITLKPSPYVGYTVNNNAVAQNGSDQSFVAEVGTSISLPAVTAPSGYQFVGWRIGSELRKNISSFSANAGYDVFPVIVSTETNTTADNFKVGSNTYTFWEDAVAAALSGGGKIIVNLTEVTLPYNVLDNTLPAAGGNYVKPVSGGGVEYILPSSVTLVVPYSTSTTVHTTVPDYSTASHVTPSPFRTLTVPNGAKITVNGAVSVDSHVSATGTGSGSWQATPSGPHGKIVMKSGSEMIFNSGTNLYCYGYINGDGMLTVKSGAKVYELFQDRSYRGGSATSDMSGNSQRVFPLPMYYVQNVEAPMKMFKGATEYVWTAATASSSAYASEQIEFIGTNGMFKLTGSSNDYLIKRYHANIDRLEVAAHGDMSLNALNVKISGLPLIGTIDIKSSEYVLPINNMDIVVQTGTTSIASSQKYGVAFIPGSKLTVNEGATFSVNAPTYFYDASEWGLYAANGSALVPVGYSTANGATAIRTADNLKDAELDVNGTVTVSDKLYTTASGAQITSSEGTGVIDFTTAPATNTATTYQATYNSSSKEMEYHAITCNNAWLINGDESYSQTVSTGTSSWYYDKPGEHWYRYLVDFNFNNNTVARDYYCELNDTVTYDASWLTNLGASVTSGSASAAVSGTDVNVTNVTANSTVTLTGTPAEYVPTFVLSEKEYQHYQMYNEGTLDQTTTINGETYYIVDQADSALAVGTTYDAPSDASMGVSAENHNTITWNMSGISATSGDPYRGTVPAGETAQGPAYIYGFYTGVVAYNSYTDEYYDTLIGAFEVLPQDVSATITLLADCGTYEEELGTQAYTSYDDNDIILDLNGYHAVGHILNRGNFTLELNGGTLDYETGATEALAKYNGTAAVLNSGTMTVQDTAGGGKITTDAIGNSSSLTNYISTVRNNTGASLTMTGGTLMTTQNVNSYSAVLLNYGTVNSSDAGLVREHKGYSIQNVGTADISINGKDLIGSVTNAANSNIDLSLGGTQMVGAINNSGTFDLDLGGGSVKTTSTTAPITNNASSTLTIDLNGGMIQYATGVTAGSTSYNGKAAIINSGALTIADTAGEGKVTADSITTSSSVANYTSAVYNKSGATLTMTGGTLQNKPASVNNYSTALLNYGTVNISDSTVTTSRGYGIYNTSSGTIELLKDSDVSVTHASGGYGIYNNAGKITKISGGSVSGKNTVALYNYNGGTITTLENTNISVTTPTTKNVYAVWNYGATITTMDGCTISGNSGINNRNLRGDANTVATGATISKYGVIDTIKNTTVNVGQYAVYNGATIGTMIDSTFTASPASSIVYGTYGTSNLNKDYPQCYTIYNSNVWWYDTAVWKQTNTYVDNDGTSMLQHRTNEYKTSDDYMPTIGAITNCTINAANTSASAAYGYALVNYGVINDINGSSTIQTYKHPDNTSTKLTGSQFALQNINGGKIGSIGSDVTISAQTYAIDNRGARYVSTDVDYSTTYLASGALKSGGLATDYDYTFADVSTIGSIAGTVSATSSAAIQNYSKINSISGDISAPYNVIVNQIAATTTTSIEVATANERVIEHRRFTNDDASLAANEIGRDFEYTRNTTDGCTIGEITGTVTATGAGYQAIYNYGHIGTLGGTVTTPTGKAAKDSNYYPLIFNGDQRQASLKQTEDYYVESNDYGATKYLREYTFDVPTIDTISCTATNPQDYTIRNLGTINTLSGTISGKTITVANEYSGTFRTRKTITYYSSASLLAATSASSEVNYEYTKDQAKINNIDGATISTTGTTLALRNYGYVGEIKDSTITSTTTNTIQNGAATTNSTVTSYTSNRLDVLTGCTPAKSSCALAYDQTQTINEDAVRAPATINKIGAGNYFQGTYFTLYNMGRINEIDSGSGKKSIIYGSSRQALYNLQGCYSRVTNTDAVLTNATGTTTNNYTYEYAPAYIGTIKNVFILGKRQAILNGDGTADYCSETPVTIGEIGEGTEARTSATDTYNAVQNTKTYARIGEISGGVYMTGTGSGIYALNNDGTAYPILVSGGDFRGGDGTRALAIKSPDTASKYTYPAGMKLSTGTETATYYTLSNKVLTAKTNSFYYIQGLTYNVTWKNGSTTLETDTDVAGGSTPTYNGSTPTKAATDEFTYEFDGWTSSVDGQVYATADLPPVAADVTYTAHFKETKNKYTVTWDINGTTTSDVYEYGAFPSYTGDPAVPTKPEDAQYTYAFSGWDPSPAAVTGNITYTAQFTPTVKTYEITWIDGNGETLKTEQVAYGETPSYSGDSPTKTGDAQYSYTFNNTWSPAITSVTGPKTYTAQFDSSVNEYTITWNVNGTTTTSDVAYGETPVYPGETPTKTGDAQYSYTFAGWSTDGETVIATLPDVSAAATYIAVFTQSVNKYDITWKDGNGDTLKTEQVAYGSTPSYDGTEPTKQGDAQYSYTFNNTWSPAITSVTKAATYTAQFDSTVNTYTVKWIMESGSAPSEEEVKAAVDAIFTEDICKSVRTDAYAEMSDMPDAWPFMKYEGIRAQLNMTYGISTGNNGYLVNRVLYLAGQDGITAQTVDNAWAADKDVVVSQVLDSNNLLTDEQRTTLTALSGPTVTILETDENVAYGTVPTFDGTTPTKEGDAQYSYSFAGWSTDGENVLDPLTGITGDTTYIAVFTQTVNTYTVTWNVDGVTTTADYEYGATPVYNNGVDPTKESANGINYLFTGWTPEIAPVTADVTYTAVFQEEEIFNKHSLTLDGTIGVNYYLVMPEGYDADNTYIDFSWGYKYISTNTYSTEEPYSKTGVVGEADGDYVKFTVYVAAKELNDEITATLKEKGSGTVLATEKYRGTDYAYDMLKRIEKDSESVNVPAGKTIDQLKALVIDTLIYSAKSQVNFAYYSGVNEKFSDLATYRFGEEEGPYNDVFKDYTDEQKAVDTSKLSGNIVSTLPSGMSYYGGSLNLGSETSYMVVFRNNNKLQPTLSAQYADAPQDTLEVQGQYSGIAAGFTILNLPAARVTDNITLTLDGSYTATINAGAYIRTVLTGNYSDSLKEAITALYWYNQSAKVFFSKENEG